MTDIVYLSQLPAATSANAADIFAVTQGSTGAGTGTTRKMSIATLSTLVASSTINVSAYGAIGDGITDDTIAIQAALDAGAGHNVHFGNGTYAISNTLGIHSNTRLTMEPGGLIVPISNTVWNGFTARTSAAVNHGNPNTRAYAFTNVNWDQGTRMDTGIVLDGMNFSLGNFPNTLLSAVFFRKVTNCTVTRCTFTSLQAGAIFLAGAYCEASFNRASNIITIANWWEGPLGGRCIGNISISPPVLGGNSDCIEYTADGSDQGDPDTQASDWICTDNILFGGAGAGSAAISVDGTRTCGINRVIIANNIINLTGYTGAVGINVQGYLTNAVSVTGNTIQGVFGATAITVINSPGIAGPSGCQITHNRLVNCSSPISSQVAVAFLSYPQYPGSGSGGTAGTYALAFSGGGGTGAAGTFTVAGGAIVGGSIRVTAGGSGYTSPPAVSFAACPGLVLVAQSAPLTSLGVTYGIIATGDRSFIQGNTMVGCSYPVLGWVAGDYSVIETGTSTGGILYRWQVDKTTSLMFDYNIDSGRVEIDSPLLVTGAAQFNSTVSSTGLATLGSILSYGGMTINGVSQFGALSSTGAAAFASLTSYGTFKSNADSQFTTLSSSGVATFASIVSYNTIRINGDSQFATLGASGLASLASVTATTLSVGGSPALTSGTSTAGGSIVAVNVAASPSAYTATARGTVYVSAGAGISITLKRGAMTIPTGAVAGAIDVISGDLVTVTYSTAPTLNFAPA